MAPRKRPHKGLPAPNRVLDIENNGEFLSVQFVRDNGEIAIGEYKRIGWGYPPSEEMGWVNKILTSPPRTIYGRPPGEVAARGRPRRAKGE